MKQIYLQLVELNNPSMSEILLLDMEDINYDDPLVLPSVIKPASSLIV